MQLEEEELIAEILGTSPSGEYCRWPRITASPPGSPEIAAAKSSLSRIWCAGDYDRLARYMEDEAEAFYGRLAVQPGSRLLDVACGSGQLAIIAARQGVDATGVDLGCNMVERASEQARVEGLSASFREADAEALPFSDATFDVVVSLTGAMFAPRPNVVAKELLRVCRQGGTIAMANWTPQSLMGQLFMTISRFLAPSGMPDPGLWGDEATVRERLGAGVRNLELRRRKAVLDFPFPPSEVARLFQTYHGPANHAFASLDGIGRMSLQIEMEELWSTHNRATDGLTKVDAEWLEVIAERA